MEEITIHTIAEEAGVSAATVSRVINHPSLVAVKTRERVARIMRERNFQASREAQWVGRRQRRSCAAGRIGFLAPDVAHRSAEAITSEMAKGIQKTLAEHGLDLLLYHFHWTENGPWIPPRVMFENSVDGMLIRPPPDRAVLLELCRNRKAVVLGNTFPGVPAPTVLADDWTGMRLVLDYLHELGHRRIAFLNGPSAATPYLRRYQAFRMRQEEAGVAHDESLVHHHHAWASSDEEVDRVCRSLLDRWLARKDPPTAVATGSDGFAVAIIRAARERGIKVPGDLSVTGYGDQYYAAFVDPPLTTAHISNQAIGEMGALQLLQILQGARYSVESLVRPTFVERRSCAALQKASSPA